LENAEGGNLGRHHFRHRRTVMYRHLLIATDGSALAEVGVTNGLALAQALNAKVSIVTVQTIDRFDFPAEENKRAEVTKRHAADALSRAERMAKKIGISCQTIELGDGDPPQAIVGLAEQNGCDLIVMGSHGRTGLALDLLGSVTSKVLNLAKTPVLVCRLR
jgi:nucleotide-binding universal stress UspA family protein